MAHWKIERRRGVCGGCERQFDDGERHRSCLLVAGEAGLVRQDLCATCLDARGAPQGALFWWSTRHELDRKRTVQMDLGSLERLFLELEGREELAVRELRYVLCLLLMRKRRLKVERIQRDAEGESFVVKRPRRDARYQVYVHDFTPARMDEIRAELQAIFDGAEGEAGVRLSEPNPDAAPEPDDGTVAEPEPAAQAESGDPSSA
jgi:hypothetical protein